MHYNHALKQTLNSVCEINEVYPNFYWVKLYKQVTLMRLRLAHETPLVFLQTFSIINLSQEFADCKLTPVGCRLDVDARIFVLFRDTKSMRDNSNEFTFVLSDLSSEKRL